MLGRLRRPSLVSKQYLLICSTCMLGRCLSLLGKGLGSLDCSGLWHGRQALFLYSLRLLSLVQEMSIHSSRIQSKQCNTWHAGCCKGRARECGQCPNRLDVWCPVSHISKHSEALQFSSCQGYQWDSVCKAMTTDEKSKKQIPKTTVLGMVIEAVALRADPP